MLASNIHRKVLRYTRNVEQGATFCLVVQQECLPQAILGTDIICQAKSGMGKTAVFVLAVLQQLVPTDGEIDTLVLCHTRELAYQICQVTHTHVMLLCLVWPSLSCPPPGV